MNQIKVSAKRHLAKTISYRIISTLVGFLIMWWATGNITFGAAFGVAELLYKPIQYYIHERVWYRFIKFGLVEVKPSKTPKPKKSPEPESTLLTGLPDETQKKIKRLTYTKKTD
jgi:uncharacterized membrane protein